MRYAPAHYRQGSYVVLTLYWGGQVIRVSGDALDIETADGDICVEAGLADVEIATDASPTGGEGNPSSISVEALLPVDVPALVAAGYDISTARAEVAVWAFGTTWEEREVLLLGALSDPETGAKDEPVRFTVQADAWTDRALGPATSTQLVDGTTWLHADTLDEPWLGMTYPTIIGCPGLVSTSIQSQGRITGSGAVWAHYSPVDSGSSYYYYGLILVLAGHHVQAQSVTLAHDDYPEGIRVVVKNGVDERGQPIAFVPFYATTTSDDPFYWDGTLGHYVWGAGPYGLGAPQMVAAGFLSVAQRQIYVAWRDEDDVSRGGLEVGGKLVRRAGDVLTWALRQTTLPVDLARCATESERINHILLDCIIEVRMSPWQWIRDHLLPILPISILPGPKGLHFVVWRWDARPSDAVAVFDLDLDPEIGRESALRCENHQVANQFTLAFAFSYRTMNYTTKAELGAWPYDASAPLRRSSLLCQISQQALRDASGGPMVIEEQIKTSVLYDTESAHAALRMIAAGRTLPWQPFSISAPEGTYGHVEEGAVVRVNDSSVGVLDRVALVRGRKLNSPSWGVVTYDLVLQPLPYRDRVGL